MLILIRGGFLIVLSLVVHYCDIDEAAVNSFLAADSMGRFFNALIKGHFACTTGHVPAY
jgi:hypothetical protein